MDKARWSHFNLIRLLAALQVLIVHGCNHLKINNFFVDAINILPGVPIFFFISGLLISAAYDRSYPNNLNKYISNRFLRIYPALWACVGISCLLVFCTGYFETVTFSSSSFLVWMGAQLSFFQFYNPSFMHGFGVGTLNGALWTISVELQFYCLTPVLFYVFNRRKSLLGFIFVGSLITNLFFRFYGDKSHLIAKLIHVSFVPWIYIFILGFWVYKNRSRVETLLDKSYMPILIAGFLLSMCFIGSYNANASNSINPIAVLFLAGILIKLSKLNFGKLTKTQAFIEKNDFSYSLYLYHMPVLNLLLYVHFNSPVFTLISLVVITSCFSIGSWFLIENPILKIKNKTLSGRSKFIKEINSTP